MMVTLHSRNTITTTKVVHSQVYFFQCDKEIPYYETTVITIARCFEKLVIVFVLFLFCVTSISSNENADLQKMLYKEDKPSKS